MSDIDISVGLFFASSIVSALVFTVARNSPELKYKPLLVRGYLKAKALITH